MSQQQLNYNSNHPVYSHQIIQGAPQITNSYSVGAEKRYSEKFTSGTSNAVHGASRFAVNSPAIRTPKNQKIVYITNNEQQQAVQGQAVIGGHQIVQGHQKLVSGTQLIQGSQLIGGQAVQQVIHPQQIVSGPIITTRQSAVYQQVEQVPQIITTTVPSQSQLISQQQANLLVSNSPSHIQVVKSVVQTPPSVIHTKQVISASPVVHTTSEIIKSTQNVSYSSNDELLIKELEGYKKKCAHLETHILEYKQKFEVIRITESQLTEVLTENRNLAQQINEYLMQITQYRQQIEQLKLRLNQTAIFEQEYKKIQDIYNQQLILIEQMKNELIMKSNKIQELLHKDEENQRIIQNLMNQLQGMQDQNDEIVKRSKRDKDNKDKEYQDKIDALNQKLADKEKELQNILFALSNSENSKYQGDLQLKNLQDNIAYLQIEIKNKDETVKAKNAEIDRLREQLNNLQINIYQLQNVEQEKQRLQQVIENKNQEIEQWKKSYADQDQKINELRSQVTNIYVLQNQIQNLQRENEGLRNMIDQKEDDVKRSKKREKELEKESDDKKVLLYEKSQYEAKLQLLTNEIENLTRTLQQKQTENEDLRLKITQIQSQVYLLQHNETVVINLNTQITNLENDLKAARELAQKLEYETISLKSQIAERDYKIQGLTQEINNLKSISNEYNQVRQSVNETELKVITLNQTINKLNLTIQQKDHEIEYYRNANKNLAEDNEKMKKLIAELQIIVHQLEITLKETNIQLNIYKETQNTNLSLYSQIDQLKKQLNESELRYEELLKKYNFEKEQYENRLVLLSTETQRKDFMINSKNQEIEQLRTQLISYTEIQIQYKSTQDRIQYLLQEIDRLTADNQALAKELEIVRLRYAQYAVLELQIQDLLMRIVLQSAEVESLRSLVNQNKQENNSLRQSQLNVYRY
ncbi:hypothetical protein TTHERM_00013760 (macronuclear) [Tetrahymena thermophila SB210]|uniref:Uncharacterized protein n=1 Tax=Tetrahymena thermophila (strain SB210) TaxID=312017 RepID=Q22RL2_TETTS|nr:hypothetical protein TTHERM_00013760 [Tetrahymena thermophila SB210]EAR88110.1 hypothetical protein TTHERM_00013760 [Tetrahymena thermophila SB210]|eukprot:XP_001008355.1 hypothetical protein TTHERM_00013760 [Tetrahymena thermophila SB210]